MERFFRLAAVVAVFSLLVGFGGCAPDTLVGADSESVVLAGGNDGDGHNNIGNDGDGHNNIGNDGDGHNNIGNDGDGHNN